MGCFFQTLRKKRFFAEVTGTFVFGKVGFDWVVNNRQFLPDSYTCFTNHIGLTDSRGDLILASNDIVLSFPNKDCVLEGGQTKRLPEARRGFLQRHPYARRGRVGLEKGFENEEKGRIFFHIADIIKRTRPCAFFLENVDHLVIYDKDGAFRKIIEMLETELKYKVIGVDLLDGGKPCYNPKSFVRNSRDFGVPQNQPWTYIIGFDRERFALHLLHLLPSELPKGRERQLCADLNDGLERDVEAKHYMASGYLDTLVRH